MEWIPSAKVSASVCLSVPAQIVEITDPAQQRALVDMAGVRREVSVAMLGVDGDDGARVGDWVLVHLGFALERIDEAAAKEILDGLERLGNLYEPEIEEHAAAMGAVDLSRSAPPSS